MKPAKEIRSRDQGHTQQGGYSFTVQTVSYSMWAENLVVIKDLLSTTHVQLLCMQGCKEQQNIFCEIKVL